MSMEMSETEDVNKRDISQCFSDTNQLSTLTASPLCFDTCRLSFMSHLFPRIIFSTSLEACWKLNPKKIIHYVLQIQKNVLLLKKSFPQKKFISLESRNLPLQYFWSSSWCFQMIFRRWCRKPTWFPAVEEIEKYENNWANKQAIKNTTHIM